MSLVAKFFGTRLVLLPRAGIAGASGDRLESEAVADLKGRLFLFSSSASVFGASLSLLQFICPTGAGLAAKVKWNYGGVSAHVRGRFEWLSL